MKANGMPDGTVPAHRVVLAMVACNGKIDELLKNHAISAVFSSWWSTQLEFFCDRLLEVVLIELCTILMQEVARMLLFTFNTLTSSVTEVTNQIMPLIRNGNLANGTLWSLY